MKVVMKSTIEKREVEGGNEVLPRGEREGPEGTNLCRVILRFAGQAERV